MTSAGAGPDLNPFSSMFDAWRGFFNLAPTALNQPILPDWSFFRVDETNSSAPDTERAVVEQESYGKQIGILLDAVAQLIPEQAAGSSDAQDPAFTAVTDLKASVDKIKAGQAAKRLARAPSDLALVKREKPDAYAAITKELRKALG